MNIVEIIFELGINLLETFIIVEFMTKYLGYKYNKGKYIAFSCAWLVIFTELCLRNYIIEFEYLGGGAPIILYLLYAMLFLNGSFLLKLWLSIVIQGIIAIIAMGTNLIVCNIIGYDPNAMISIFNSVRVISVIITKILLFYVTRIILKHKYKNPLEKHSWFLLILIPMISIFSLYALMLAAINHEEIKVYILCGMAGIVIADIVTYYFFTVLNKNYEAKLKIRLLEQQNENARKSIESSEAFVKEMRGVKHDIKNQLLTILNYIENGNTKEATKHINDLTDNCLPNVQSFINTNNIAFNAILNSKIALCDLKEIHIAVNAEQNCIKNIEDTDIVILFGNLLDNAIEAAEKTNQKNIFVELKTRGTYLSILVTNTIHSSVLVNNKDLRTSKEDKQEHGIGIKNINTIVEKYEGMMEFFEEENIFCCHILLDSNLIICEPTINYL